MKIVLLHPNFPAQFHYLAENLGSNSKNKVLFVTKCVERQISGVEKIIYHEAREQSDEVHPAVGKAEKAVIQGQGAYSALYEMKKRGFYPDVIYGHSGWGPTLFMKELFPKAALICYFEWFNHVEGRDINFGAEEMSTDAAKHFVRCSNVPSLLDLYVCDRGVSPMFWQKDQFPKEYHKKIIVRHDGIDTDAYCPLSGARSMLLQYGINISDAKQIVTYVARGKDVYRGFPQFMEAVAILQRRLPHCHVIIVGADHSAYGKALPDGRSYKQEMLERFAFDHKRIHFTGLAPRKVYTKILQASDVHVYLTRPFVLSWSFLEAMSTECLVVASDTPPVREVMQHGINGLLTDFFSSQQIAESIENALINKKEFLNIRKNARETILERYAFKKLLPLHIKMLLEASSRGG